MNTGLAAGMIVFVMVVGVGAGYIGGIVNTPGTTVTNISVQTQTSSTTVTLTTPTTVTQSVTTTTTQSVTQSVTQAITSTATRSVTNTVQARSSTVNYVVVPDFGGPAFDAFVLAGNVNSTGVTLGTNTTAPGRNNNNATVTAGVPITFVITNIDTAVLLNFTGSVSTPFSIYNDSAAGQVALQYTKGQSISLMPISHTFTIKSLGIDIPIPPDTIITFTYTFKPGVYTFLCETPCGPGMTTPGYMSGSIVAA